MKHGKINATSAPAFVKHLELLANLSPDKTQAGLYAFDTFAALKRMEKTANKLTTELCNGTTKEREAYIEKKLDKILTEVNRLLTVKTAFINRDPRGYALKIKAEEAKKLAMYQDWGGYGILAPEF